MPDQLIYTRWQNPNRAALERTMAELEGGAVAHAISSGSAAMLTVFQALRPGDHIVSSDDMYFGIRVQLNEFFAPWGLGNDLCRYERPGCPARSPCDPRPNSSSLKRRPIP